MPVSQRLVISKVIGTGRLGVKDGGKDLGNVGAVSGIQVRFFPLSLLFCGPLAAGDSRFDGGGRIFGAQCLAGNSCVGLVIDEDLVMRVSPIDWRPDDLDAVIL